MLSSHARSVCKMNVVTDAGEMSGTGFRVGENKILTNWHVTHDKESKHVATAISAEFNYELVSKKQPVQSSEADDWALVTTAEPIELDCPPIKFSAVVPKLNQPAYIIQHPDGRRKRLGFVRNQISKVTDRVVHYLTDTQEGSSGSPVFNRAGELIALHRAGGRPQIIVGRPPAKKNEGIRISRVAQGLKDIGGLSIKY